jgi:hypothetical protein
MTKLHGQIKASTKKRDNAVTERNTLALDMGARDLSLAVLKGSKSWFWEEFSFPGAQSAYGNIPPSIKRNMVRLLCQRDRAKEEIAFAKEDAQLAHAYLEKCKQQVKDAVLSSIDASSADQTADDVQRCRGARCILLREMLRLAAEISERANIVSHMKRHLEP